MHLVGMIDFLEGKLPLPPYADDVPSPCDKIESFLSIAERTAKLQRSLLLAENYFFGSFQLISSPTLTYLESKMEQWTAQVTKSWTEVSNINCTLQVNGRMIQFDFDFAQSVVRLSVLWSDVSALDETVKTIEDALRLRTGDGDWLGQQNFVGVKRNYLTESRIDKAWFQQIVDFLRKLTSGRPSFTEARTFIESRVDPDSILGDVDEWSKEVQRRWYDVQFLTCWLSNNEVNFFFWCDPGREMVTAEVKSWTIDRVQNVLADFQGALKLVQVADISNRDIKLVEFYDIREDEHSELKVPFNVALTEAIKSAVQDAFISKFNKTPVVADASLTDQEGNRESFRKLDDLYKALNENPEFIELNLCVDGPQKNWLALTVNRNSRRLELRAELETKEFSWLSYKIFAKKLPIRSQQKEIDSKQGGSAKEHAEKAPASDSSLVKIWIASLSVLIPALGSLIIFVLPEWTPRYTLEIQRPVGNSSGSTTLLSDTLELSWSLTERRFWADRFCPNIPAAVRISRREDGHDAILLEQMSPLIEKHLSPGTYDVTVTSAKPAKPAILTISIAKAP